MAKHLLDLGIYKRGCHLQVASSQRHQTMAPRIMGTGGEEERTGRQAWHKAFILLCDISETEDQSHGNMCTRLKSSPLLGRRNL